MMCLRCTTWKPGVRTRHVLMPCDCWRTVLAFLATSQRNRLRQLARWFATLPPRGHCRDPRWTPERALHVVCAPGERGRRLCAVYRGPWVPDVRYDPESRSVAVRHAIVTADGWSFERLRWYGRNAQGVAQQAGLRP